MCFIVKKSTICITILNRFWKCVTGSWRSIHLKGALRRSSSLKVYTLILLRIIIQSKRVVKSACLVECCNNDDEENYYLSHLSGYYYFFLFKLREDIVIIIFLLLLFLFCVMKILLPSLYSLMPHSMIN
jgi:hypothetical protein